QTNGGSTSSLQSEINITPLVDVVLVLLIIFMVVVPLLMQGYDVATPPPSAESAPPPAEVSQLILVGGPAISNVVAPPAGEGRPADCHVILAGSEIPVSELPGRVSQILGGRSADERVLFLVADDRLNYEATLRIVDLAKSAVDDLKIEF